MNIKKQFHNWYRYLKGSAEYRALYKKLNIHNRLVKKSFHTTHKHAKKILSKHSVHLDTLRHASTKAAAGAILASSLFVSPAYSHNNKNEVDINKMLVSEIPDAPVNKIEKAGPQNPNKTLYSQEDFANKIKEIMSSSTQREGKLSAQQLSDIQKMVKDQFNIDISNATPDGFELLDHYGYTGAEQHIPTKPGDSAANHVSKDEPLAILTGLTGGKGAWGYAPKAEETWYVVAQTFRSPQFGTAATKHLAGQRYVVIQIPSERNGNHFFIGVGGIWDAGPGVSTKKVFGLSPEYWYHLGSVGGSSRNDKIIMLPVNGTDIPSNKLGPLGF